MITKFLQQPLALKLAEIWLLLLVVVGLYQYTFIVLLVLSILFTFTSIIIIIGYIISTPEDRIKILK